MNYHHLLVEQRGAIAIATINRAERANALDYEVLEELEHYALSLREDADTRVVVFTGAGRHFSSGADLNGVGDDVGPMVLRRRRVRIGARAISALYGISQITIAAWRGAAMGGGACIATALDFRVGADDCFAQYPEIDIGVNLMWQSLPLCVHLVGPARAKRLVIGGERVPGPVLHDWGLLDAICPAGEVLDRALEMARHYAAKAPIPAQMIKESVNRIVSALDHAVMHMDADQNLLTRATEDRALAHAAYRAKMTPDFGGD